ncbi:MAG TPA: ABC transporter permease [Trebonia sp.]|jgi:peptide/nickel transport system permease protein
MSAAGLTAPVPGRTRAVLARIAFLGPARIVLSLLGLAAVLMICWPGLFTHYLPSSIDANAILKPPSLTHLLGTDEAGGDIWARVVYATRLEAYIAGGSVVVALVIGIPAGLLAGYGGRVLDGALSGISAATLAFPLILFAILVVASFGTNPTTLVIIIGFIFFPRIFLLVRSQTLALREREFVVAVRVTGASPLRSLVRHVLPNAAGPLFTLVPQLMAEAILTEAGLSYLGLGVQLPRATWGTILQASKNYYVTDPSYAITAGVIITVASALLMYAGELISESVNPLHRRRLR